MHRLFPKIGGTSSWTSPKLQVAVPPVLSRQMQEDGGRGSRGTRSEQRVGDGGMPSTTVSSRHSHGDKPLISGAPIRGLNALGAKREALTLQYSQSRRVP